MFRLIVCAMSLALLSGCKLAIIVAEGGEVQSNFSGVCAAGSVCVQEITDTSFSETLTAVADPGWEFERWSTGGNFFCADLTDPQCELSLAWGEGIAEVEAVVESGETFYVMPIFKCVGTCAGSPITDTIVVGDKEWAQPSLFTDVTGEQVAARCADGPCNPNTSLFGWSLFGWHWATVDDVNALFNSYLTVGTLGPGPDSLEFDNDTDHVLHVFNAGFQPTLENSSKRFLSGWTSDNQFNDEEETVEHYIGWIVDNQGTFGGADVFATTRREAIGNSNREVGLWLYRPVSQ